MQISAEPFERTLDNAQAQGARAPSVRGLGVAAVVIFAWALSQGAALFWFRFVGPWAALAPLLVAWLTWLQVGLFIVAHDCMHGALVPGWASVHRPLGRLCLSLYGGLDFDALAMKHRDHHDYPGSAFDPDFSPQAPHSFWPWYQAFMQRHVEMRQLLVVTLAFNTSLFWIGIPFLNLFAFWALPLLLSSLQLFYFGTYLPHRSGHAGFADEHRARSNDYAPWLSLLSCFHFGYHHEHHLRPELPFWQLPAYRAARKARAE